MKSRLFRHLGLPLLTLGLFASPLVDACRIIIPPPWPWPPPHPHPIPPPWPPPERPALLPMEVRSHKATIDIRNGVARVAIEAVFRNPNSSRIEGLYVYPIGPNAAVSSFAMTLDGKTLEAQLLDADKARHEYEEIVRKMRDPALLEYLDQGLLKARVFPLEPGKDVTVTLTYEDRCSRTGTVSRFVYPLLSARPEGKGRIGKFSCTVQVETANGLKSLTCPGFDAKTERNGANSATLTVDANDFTPDKELQVLYTESKKKVGVDFLSHRRGDDGYFMLLIAPDSELQAAEIAAKDITFVLDTSGSMMGSKIEQAKQALTFCIDSLNPTDSFNLIAFANDVTPYAPAAVPATPENRRQAREFVEKIKPLGGTAIDDALAFVLAAKPVPKKVGMVVLLTDGLPTVGEVDVIKILSRMEGKKDRRLFTFGVGYDVNTRLLDGLAAASGGCPAYVRPDENLEVALSNFYTTIAFPVMTGLKLDSGSARLSELNPRRMPDLFKGGQIAVTGRFTGSGKVNMKLAGTVAGTTEQFPFEADLAGDPANVFIPRLWAIGQVAYLQEQIRLHGSNPELVEEIKRLGRQYGILTPYTSFLIVEQGVDQARREEFRGVFHEAERAAATDASGAVAVETASLNRTMRFGGEAKSIAAAAPMPAGAWGGAHARVADEVSRLDVQEYVVKVWDKAFYRRSSDGFWYDAEIATGTTPKADVEVQAWSEEFFRLLKTQPVLAKYLLAGPNLVVRLDGKIIRIRE